MIHRNSVNAGSERRAGHKMDMIVTGAAGFIGSHLCDRLLERGHSVLGIDNFSRGVQENLKKAAGNSRFYLVTCDLADETAVRSTVDPLLMNSVPTAVWHMAANSDIPAGLADPAVDLRDTFLTTYNVLGVMRRRGIRQIAFASTSAVYGEHREKLVETLGPLLPISNYGAMKLASEAAISASTESHFERACIFRFPNVVGDRGTHGVIYDLLGKLINRPNTLEVLGNGTQKKPYLHVSELVDAMLFIWDNADERRALYNIGPHDDGVEVSYIAQTVADIADMGVPLHYTGGDRGWVGDVPRFFYSVEKLSKLGWRPKLSSEEAVRRAVEELAAERGMTG